MPSLDQVFQSMQAAGLPPLPAGHPICDGKERRFGPKKKAWYKLTEIAGCDGKPAIFGAFGYWRGRSNGAVGVALSDGEATREQLLEARRRQEEAARQEEEKRLRVAQLAAGRAHTQWQAASTDGDSPYLQRKQIALENARIDADGTLLVPMMKYSRQEGSRLVGLQKIAPDGSKRFNKGMDKVGSACLLGVLNDASPVVLVAEGYATAGSVRLAVDGAHPAMVAFDAGNLMAVATGLRRDFPQTHILFAADDDWQLRRRLAKCLVKAFRVAATIAVDDLDQVLALDDFDEDDRSDKQLAARLELAAGARVTLAVNGTEHVLQAEDGTPVRVTATWRDDANGVPFIEADVRGAKVIRSEKFENAGVSAARAAAAAVGNASVVFPVFADRGERKWTDFNDLHVQESLDAVRLQLQAAIDAAPCVPDASLEDETPPPAPSGDDCAAADAEPPAAVDGVPGDSPDPLSEPAATNVTPIRQGLVPLEWALAHCALVQGSTDVWDSLNKLRMKRPAFVSMVGKDAAKQWESHAERRSISPRNLPKTVRGVAVQAGGGGDDGIVMMLERYTLLYGTKTVWDAEKKTVLGYDAMALARGADLASRWLAHPLHMEKDLDKLVFDPTQRVDLNTHINMFEGFPLTPRKDEAKAGLVLDLLYSLCSSEANSEDLFKWVLCWLAYPLQHPGAKMQSAMLFFGEKQGTGKSLFFEGIVKPIYGVHGATGGQHQLENTYTMWRSQKLYVLFEEILSRQDKYSYFGLIKHMITGRDTPITQKFKDDRTEANHLNCVMLSNEFQAVPLEPEDRRFLVVDVKNDLDPALLASIKAVLDDGLIEAFYAFLLDYPLGDFNPHTKPLMTASKQRVINFGRPDWEAFYLAWAAGDIDAPYCSCLATDLYILYSRYCSRYGFRSLTLTKFSELIAQRLQKDRQWVSFGIKKKKLLTVFHVPQQEDEPVETLEKQCQRFRDLADIKGEE